MFTLKTTVLESIQSRLHESMELFDCQTAWVFGVPVPLDDPGFREYSKQTA